MSENQPSSLDGVALKLPVLVVPALLETGASGTGVVQEDGSTTHVIVNDAMDKDANETEDHLNTTKKYSDLLAHRNYNGYMVELMKTTGNERLMIIAVHELGLLIRSARPEAHIVAMLEKDDSIFIAKLLGFIESDFAFVKVLDKVLYIFAQIFLWIDSKVLDKFAMSIVILALRTMSTQTAEFSPLSYACFLMDTITSSTNQQQHLEKFKTAGGFDLVALVLSYCAEIRVVCDQRGYRNTYMRNNYFGALNHVFELLARFGGNWKRPLGTHASHGVGIEDDIVSLMRGFASKEIIQTKGCIILCNFAELNLQDFDTGNNRCVATVLKMLHKVPQDYESQNLVCITLQKLMGVAIFMLSIGTYWNERTPP